MIPAQIEVITLFVDDIAATRKFYDTVFAPEVVFSDAVSAVLSFGGVMINLLENAQAPELVAPLPVAPSASGSRLLLTVRVDSVDAEVTKLRAAGIDLVNGPMDRPWGRRTAAFADPSGHVWEIAQEI